MVSLYFIDISLSIHGQFLRPLPLPFYLYFYRSCDDIEPSYINVLYQSEIIAWTFVSISVGCLETSNTTLSMIHLSRVSWNRENYIEYDPSQ